MKKKYEKPAIIFEEFEMSQNIANCGSDAVGSGHGKPNHASKETCGWDLGYGYGTIFVNEVVCSMIMEDNGEYEGICYNTPTSAMVVFSS